MIKGRIEFRHILETVLIRSDGVGRFVSEFRDRVGRFVNVNQLVEPEGTIVAMVDHETTLVI